MMILPRSLLFLLVTIAFIALGISADPLRDQLKAATVKKDSHAQIDLIRRLLDQDDQDDQESDDALRRQLTNLWMTVADYEMAERTLHDWPAAPAGYRAIIEADILLGRDRNRAEALAGLESYHARQPEDRTVTLRLVEVLSGDNDSRRIDEVLTAAPGAEDDATLLLRRARARRSLTHFEQALNDFAAADRIDPKVTKDDRPAFERLGDALPALNVVTKKLAENPDDFRLLVHRAQLYREVDADAERIAADAKAALAVHPESLAATLLYAATQSQKIAREKFSVDLQKPAPSDHDLGRLVTLDLRLAKKNHEAKVLADRSLVLNQTGQYQLGLRDAEAALKINPAQSTALRERIHALALLQETSRAAEAFREMQRVNAPSADLAAACDYLAIGELESYRDEAALEYATGAIEAKPSVERYQTRATIWQRLGRAARAQEDLRQAQALKKNQ